MNFSYFFFAVLVATSPALAERTLIRGYMPGPKSGYTEAFVAIDGEKITSVGPTRPAGKFDSELITNDVIYPSLMNLHNHTKQNVLPLWKLAQGQFGNRFEWRSWAPYKKSVSENMNPWISDPTATCAAFRFSHLRAMVDGTSHLQGASSCVGGFLIHRAEDSDAFDGYRKAAQAPTDFLYPDELAKVYQPSIFSLMDPDAWMSWREDRSQATPKSTYLKAFDKWKSKADLKAAKRYLDFQHSGVTGKSKYLADPKHSAVITHIAEGRRDDPYNAYEFDLLVQLGLDLPGVALIHGVGIDEAGFQYMAKRGMSLVWSPFSNLLLYGQTADVEAALKAGVTVALGSDWAPTGSRSVLEELKIAKAYVQRMNLDRLITDRVLVDMVTRAPAKILGVEDVAGAVAPGKLADLILVRRSATDPYTNLVEADSSSINLLVVDGKPTYGDPKYLSRLGQKKTEALSACGFSKALVTPVTVEGKKNGFDSAANVVKFLNKAMTAKRKEREARGDDPQYLVDAPTLFACESPEYKKQVEDFLESDFVLDLREWKEKRKQFGLTGTILKKMAKDFGQETL